MSGLKVYSRIYTALLSPTLATDPVHSTFVGAVKSNFYEKLLNAFPLLMSERVTGVLVVAESVVAPFTFSFFSRL